MTSDDSRSAVNRSRKRFLQNAGMMSAGAMLGGALPAAHAASRTGVASTRAPETQAEPGTPAPTRLAQADIPANANINANSAMRGGMILGETDVRDFGAKGDGKTDDTKAFQAAINDASTRGGGTVFIPQGRYLISGHLNLLPHVTLRGALEAPDIGMTRGEDAVLFGSVLLATEGAGNEGGTPFLTMNRASTLKGMTIFYPEQKAPIPVAYPWTIRGNGDSIAIIDCLLVNPYQAIDFGTNICQRHFIFNLEAQPLYRGLFVDQCYDIGRVENVHFWAFWKNDPELYKWISANGIAFQFGRTDWQFLIGCFCIFYKIGFHFADFGHGGGNVLLTNSGADVAPVAAQFDDTQVHSGATFMNCQMNGAIQVAENNSGPVRFVGCGFFGYGKNDSNVISNGHGRVSFDSCHFTWWDQNHNDSPSIHALGGVLGVNNCEFFGARNHIVIESEVRAANIVGNHFRNTRRITNNSKGHIEMVANTDEAPLPPAPLQRIFFNGFENGEASPLLNKAEAIAEPGKSALRIENGGHASTRALLLSGEKSAPDKTHGPAYYRIFNVKIAVTENTVLRYWIKPENPEGAHCGVDLVFDDGKALRETPALDLEGGAMHPAGSRGEIGKWSRVESDIGRWAKGKTITAILVAHDNCFGTNAFSAALDDIEIGERRNGKN